MPPSRRDPWLLAAVAAGALLGGIHLSWGLPASEHSWAVDGLEPLTALGIARHSFAGWNSGYYYFKYPLAYPLSLCVVYAPYLAYLFLTGGWSRPTTTYPYGFADPEQALYVLAMLGRGLSLLFFVATVAVAYGIARRLFGLQAGRLAGWLVATCYPLVYFAHTMNVDASYFFWLFLALYLAIAASESDRPVTWAALGAAAATAVSTKEQAFGFLLVLPFVALAARIRAHGGWSPLWSRPTLWMAAAAIGAAALWNNVLFNPLGFVARIAYLLGRPITAVDIPLKPVAFAWFKGDTEWLFLRQLWEGLASGLGLAIASLAVAGAITAWRRPRSAAWILVPAAAYYYLSLRGQDWIPMRYTIPLTITGALLAAAFLADLQARFTAGPARGAVRALVGFVVVLSLAQAVELVLLLRHDPRYSAEAWIAVHLPAGARGEVYQRQTYLPRFPRHLSVDFVPLDERSVAEVRERQPDFIVLSSASSQSITHAWSHDWRETGGFLVTEPEAQRLLDAIVDGSLGFQPAARFDRPPRLLRLRLTGIAPEIAIYRRPR